MTAAEKAQAKKDLLVLSDFPHGWSSTRNSDFTSTTNIAGDQQFARCLGVSAASIEFNPPQVDSPSFTDLSSKVFGDDAIMVFRSAALAHEEYAELTNPKIPSCLTSAAANQATTGTTYAPPPHISFTRLSSPKGTVAFGYTSATPTLFFGGVVLTFFTQGRFGDETFLSTFGNAKAELAPLALHLLAVERSRL
jgi:hypothetical protein